ncbi:MAG: hypothetical protein J7518_19430 [Nocardioidaceae bacterium]|nr:hypothetical protein [Nocardioidaceae bacterium]
MRVARIVVTTTMGLAIGLGATIAAAPAASASASGCGVMIIWDTGHTYYKGGKARCTSLTGGTKVRAKVTCKDNVRGYVSTQYGPWIGTSGSWSSLTCSPGATATAQDVEYQLG